ncbi:peptidase S15 [Kitasatospora herbaricolor]|uniref:CocE/NonD family hydrolase n=1 Tax=Kitasatospora herbaricolor TaxID=68217 RepID=UPI00174C256D|nr:CocE/NonD family hydrolase [Kitasatospora herbaricolor]MDQ0307586.1 putative acyl esterase [Kitasatospora herbaricolor]GGV16470.1 peptidase S15 [Kitasatospora herbaricolor]
MPQTAQHPASYPYRTVREDVRVPLADGVELHARIWRPVTEEAVPALLEYLPGRLGDGTAARDTERHPWYAGHGYASVRVDVRGHGNSGGLPGEEYSAQELADGVAVVGWLAARPWCSGSVGMFGLARGGSTALRIAALAPPALKAVVAVCADDGRRDGEAHHLGGALLAAGTHARSAGLLSLAACPPDPRYVGEDWRRMWLDRLAALEPPVHSWLTHRTGGQPPPPGPDGPEYRAIEAAVLAVAGWAAPGRDTVLRLVEQLAAPVRGLIGPWAQQYPDQGLPPGPAIGFLQETLRWWDHWLKGTDTGVLAEPALRSWIDGSGPPAGDGDRPGRWCGEESWPSPDVREIHYGLDTALRTAGTASEDRFVHVRSPQHTGVDAGSPHPAGSAADLPPDQREEDGRSVCFDSTPLPEPVEILGRPALRLRLRGRGPRGQVVARLCDVAPDGTSALITRGVLALAPGRDGGPPPAGAPGGGPDATVDVTVDLAGTGYAVPPGHHLRLALSSAYWPWIWPQPQDEGFDLDPSRSALTLPVRHLAADAGSAPVAFGPPEQAAPPDVRRPEPLTSRPERLVIRDVATGEWRLELDPGFGGPLIHPDGLVHEERTVEAYRILSGDPLGAGARTDRTVRLERPDIGWDVTVRTRSRLDCDATHLIARNQVSVLEAGSVVFSREWERRVPREAP